MFNKLICVLLKKIGNETKANGINIIKEIKRIQWGLWILGWWLNEIKKEKEKQ